MTFLIHHLLSESAGKYPDRKAVIYKGESITYRELEQSSNQLANTLNEIGVGRGDRVGIYMPKTISSIVSIFGIVKAGGTYVPIAPDAPAKRMEYILKNCGIKHLLSVRDKVTQLANTFPVDSPVEKIVLMDSNSPVGHLPIEFVTRERILNSTQDSPPSTNSIDRDLAYILYTSGSTGDPKGVMISHLNSLTFVNWAQEFFRIGENDRVASHSPLHFDLSVFDIFSTIKAGATVVIIPDGTATFPLRLAELIEKERITVWNSVPSVLVLLVTHGKLERFRFPDLRLVLFAGEVFPVKYLRQLVKHIPHADYYNQYGQTEANSSTYYQVKDLPDNDAGHIPIGKAAANFEVFAIDENNNVINRPGDIGDLYVYGSSVARGYWGNIEKTSLAFVANPLSNGSGEKAYKTGDLVTLDEDGNYIFLSRKDNMVKSRGYRIELGEIEAVISRHPGVKQVATIAIPDEVIGNRIKVFIVPFEPGSPTQSELERHCAELLPGYMIPDVMEFRQYLPMTSTGKVDRRLLVAESKVGV
ncbi:MAG: hypothetical protein A2144_01410 [Chloroflexi bacterium RBG_16_50_9]|nr:MAG: hypothetical protein A2144_01410 [Chloroflexi bacterium RBG_16_50_9]